MSTKGMGQTQPGTPVSSLLKTEGDRESTYENVRQPVVSSVSIPNTAASNRSDETYRKENFEEENSKNVKHTFAQEFNLGSESETVKCDLCKDMFKNLNLTRCDDCIYNLCDKCLDKHKSENHNISPGESINDVHKIFCEPCMLINQQNKAFKRCQDCDEMFCEPCVTIHQAQKKTRFHTIIDHVEVKELLLKDALCEPCAFKGMSDVQADFYCTDCDEKLCGRCKTAHKTQKATKGHNVLETKIKNRHECDPCLENDIHKVAERFCMTCEEFLCEDCHTTHKSLKATRGHKVYNVDEIPTGKVTTKCEPCKYLNKDTDASHFCRDCDEFFCDICSDKHRRLKATKLHAIILAEEQIQNETGKKQECFACIEIDKSSEAVAFCFDCKELLCTECLNDHRAIKATRRHRIEYSLENIQDVGIQRPEGVTEAKYLSEKAEERPTGNPFKPGQPTIDGSPKADSVQLSWKPPESFYESYQYQIRYKTTAPSDKWKFYEEQFTESTVILRKLKSDSTFVFQVRMVNNEEEGSYSDQSDCITTKQSAANHLIGFSQKLDFEGVLTKRKLILEENKLARNSTAKTRKFYLGNPNKIHCKEKTIMLVGATGSGKSTLVDGFINYILGVNWDDPFRFTLIDLEEEEKGILQNQAVSQTQWITTYCINPTEGSRLDYRLNIIDTPGFGDTRGFERDQQIVEQIRQLFSASDETGVVFLDAVCFLTKAPDARLTPTQKYIFNAILSLFGQDIADNINILITFADGKTPPVLSALKEADLPHDDYFPFNNSGLFADNCGPNMSTLSPMFWEMGCQSFKAFFSHLQNMETKSLKQTKEVLTQRYQMEITIENLGPLVSNGLNKLDGLREEIRILEQHKTEIEANKNFVYTVTETKQIKKDLPRGMHVTNCLNCNVTCHKNCQIPKDEDKHGCWAMDPHGNCTQCAELCHWSQHANTPYIFDYEQEEKTKTYEEKLEKYRFAKGEEMTHEKVVHRMWDELDELEEDIFDKMNIVTECNNILKQIALRPNPLSIKEHIDLLIEAEKQEKRPGFQKRIVVLMEFRKKCIIGDDVNRFHQDLNDTRTHSIFTARKQKKKKRNVFGQMANFLMWK